MRLGKGIEEDAKKGSCLRTASITWHMNTMGQAAGIKEPVSSLWRPALLSRMSGGQDVTKQNVAAIYTSGEKPLLIEVGRSSRFAARMVLSLLTLR
jgi:hypothetical protein